VINTTRWLSLSVDRYARSDEIGIPFAITVDHDSIKDNQVTIRERDSMSQFRVPVGHN